MKEYVFPNFWLVVCPFPERLAAFLCQCSYALQIYMPMSLSAGREGHCNTCKVIGTEMGPVQISNNSTGLTWPYKSQFFSLFIKHTQWYISGPSCAVMDMFKICKRCLFCLNFKIQIKYNEQNRPHKTAHFNLYAIQTKHTLTFTSIMLSRVWNVESYINSLKIQRFSSFLFCLTFWWCYFLHFSLCSKPLPFVIFSYS